VSFVCVCVSFVCVCVSFVCVCVLCVCASEISQNVETCLSKCGGHAGHPPPPLWRVDAMMLTQPFPARSQYHHHHHQGVPAAAAPLPQMVVGGVHAVRNGLAIKEVHIRSQHIGTCLRVERDGTVLANRRGTPTTGPAATGGAQQAAATAGNVAAATAKVGGEATTWTLEIFRVNERAERELKASRELLFSSGEATSSSVHTEEAGTTGEAATPPLVDKQERHKGEEEDGRPSSPPTATTATAGFLPTGADDSAEPAGMDVMYYFGLRSPSGHYLGLTTAMIAAPLTATAAISSPPVGSHQHHASLSSSSSTTNVAPSQPASGTPGPTAFSRGLRSTLVVNASAEEPTFDCLWVCYQVSAVTFPMYVMLFSRQELVKSQIRRGVWGLKSQRGDGPWLGVGDMGELVLLDEPFPVDARFLWGFTTVRKRVKLMSSQNRYLSAELNRTVQSMSPHIIERMRVLKYACVL